jgi:Tfp pilus assembly protein PilF
LQFDIKRFTECKTNLDIIIKDPQAGALKLKFAKSDSEQQDVPMIAAAYNVKGMVEKQQGNMEEAKKNFQKALEIQPDFALVLQNLEEINGKR